MCLLLCVSAHAGDISVSAAISLREALLDAGERYRQTTGQRVEFNFGASGQLLTQIVNGAPIDLFIPAASTQADELIRNGMADAETRRIIAANALVLIVPMDAKQHPLSFQDLTDPRFKRIAVGQPTLVPAGAYTAQVFDRLGLREALSQRLVTGVNARQVLAYVERGEAAAGVVYATDAAASKGRVRVVATADPSLHDRIEYPAVILKRASAPQDARRFIEYLIGPEAQAIFASRGFQPIAGAARSTLNQSAEAPKPPTVEVSSLRHPLAMSLRVAFASAALVALIGIPLAFGLARWRFPGRSLVDALLTVPLVLPPTVVGYLLVVAFGARGPLGTALAHAFHGYSLLFNWHGAVIASAVVALPMLYLPAKAAFAGVDREMEEVARLMGANLLQVFWHVSLPMARRGIASGLLLAFARALGEFGATVMVLGGFGKLQTLPLVVYDAYTSGDLGRAIAPVVALTAVSISVIFIYNRLPATRRE